VSRGPDGRYGYQAAQVFATPVPVTCGACVGATTGPIWRGTIAVPSGESHYGIPLNDYVPGVLCETCARFQDTAGTRQCGWCGRQVGYGGMSAQPHRYCTRSCELAARTRRRREARELARHQRCGQCGKPFTAPRQDASYCSPACRQRAYRKRLAAAAAKRAYDEAMIDAWNTQLHGG
jgi:hypothetical protein